jgi:5-methyltetrahydrofolate--homocysteine methyltransferase
MRDQENRGLETRLSLKPWNGAVPPGRLPRCGKPRSFAAMTSLLEELLAERPWLMADGATGTNLFAAGLETGDAPELWNEQHPDRIRAFHASMVEAGADIVLTNSFGGSRHRLKLHKAQDRVGSINALAARLLREVVAKAGRPVVVAGSIGPTGEILEPLGALSYADAVAAFAEQAAALAEGGVDVLWIETMSSKDEARAAVEGARTTGLPYCATLSFDTNGRTMMGVMPADWARLCHEFAPAPVGYGANCGVGAAETIAALVNMRSAESADNVIIAKGNCGIPYYVDGAIKYDGTPELMAEYARLARDAGARIVGGCCGTTPTHLRAIRAALEAHEPGPVPSLDEVVARLGQISNGAREQGGILPSAPDGGRRRNRRRGAGAGADDAAF